MNSDFLFGGILAVGFTLIVFWKVFLGFAPIPNQLLSNYGWNIVSTPFITSDVVSQLMPYKSLVIESFKNFHISLWNPYIFLGMPSLATIQGAGLYPINIVGLFTTFRQFFSIVIISQVTLAFFFTFLFLRTWVGRSVAVIGAISFTLSTYFVAWLEWGTMGASFLWLPLICWSLFQYIDKRLLRYLVVGSLALAFSVFAGHLQLSIFVYIFSAVVVSLYWFFESKEPVVILGVISAYFLGLMMSAPQLIPSLELSSFSNRLPVNYIGGSNLLNIKEFIIKVFNPLYYGGNIVGQYTGTNNYNEFTNYIGIISLAFLPMAFFGKYKKYALSFFVIAVFAALFAAGSVVYLPVQAAVPPLQKLLPLRFLMVYSFFIPVTCALGLEEYINSRSKRVGLMTVLVSLGILVTAFILNAPPFVVILSLVATLTLGANLFLKTNKTILLIILTVLCSADLMFYFNHITIFEKNSGRIKSNTYETIVADGGTSSRFLSNPDLENTGMYYGLANGTGYDSLQMSKTRRLFDAVEGQKTNNSNTISTTNITSEVYDALGIGYFIANSKEPLASCPILYGDGVWRACKRTTSFGRAYVRDEFLYSEDENERLALMLKGDLEKTVVLNKKVDLSDPVDLSYRILGIETDNERVLVNVYSNKPSILVLADTYYPGWEVYVDGKRTDILEANYILRGVKLNESGTHQVLFIYRPKSFYLGLVLSSVAILLYTLGAFPLPRRQNKRYSAKQP